MSMQAKLFGGFEIPASAMRDAARYPPDGGDADAGARVDLAIRDAFEQWPDDLPTVGECFQFRRRAQVRQQRAHRLGRTQRQQRFDQSVEGGIEIGAGVGGEAFHESS